MGIISTFSFYHDNCDYLKNNPKKFGEAIYDAISNPHTNYRSNVFHGCVIPQKSRHADDHTIYVHAGNTVVEMSQYSDTTKQIMQNSPKFFNEMLKEMEMNVKMLKKQFKEMNLK